MVHTPLEGRRQSSLSMVTLLQKMVESRASDLHLSAGSNPSLRIDGNITKLHDLDPPSPEKMQELAHELMNTQQKARFEAEGDLDFGYSIPGLARFRINVLRHQSNVGMVIRFIPLKVPSGDQLGLPLICRDLVLKPRGLVLVTGPTGSGKTTTLAAMLDHVNAFQDRHILTVEDPVEFVHPEKRCIVTQREIGIDCRSFAQALRRAMRQDPDLIMIGELRDSETMSMAITAAETGHLVLATLHTTSASQTVDRVIDGFPHEAQAQVRIQLAGTLHGVISQCLVPKVDGGRIVAHEVLVVTDAVRAMIREAKTTQIRNALQMGKAQGMMTLEESLSDLVRRDIISLKSALAVANRPHEVARAVGQAPAQRDDDLSPSTEVDV